METLTALAAQVASRRAAYAEAKAQWDALVAAFEEQHAGARESMEATKSALADEEAQLRDAALAEHRLTGYKKLPHGIGIRITTKLDYDENDAFEWAKSHELALKLDAKAFEKIAKADTPDFVQVLEVPTATLPTDTAKLLEA